MGHFIHYDRDRPWDKLVWGLVLIGLGAFFLLGTFGYLPHHLLEVWWPVFVIAMGLGSLMSARSPRGIGSGVSTTCIGMWLLIATNDWWGLGWEHSWPLAIVAAGLGSLTHALAASVWPRKEDRHAL